MSDETSAQITSAGFRQHLSSGALMGSQCAQCGRQYFPPRAVCPHCHNTDMRWCELPTTGRLVAFTGIYVAPSAFSQLGYGRDKPLFVGIVELGNGTRVNARISGLEGVPPEAVELGARVKFDRGATNAELAQIVFAVER